MKKLMLLAVAGSLAPAAFADIERAQFGGSHTVDYRTGQFVDFSPRSGTTIYTNTAGSANFAVSSTDMTAIWGDEMTTAGTGLLDEFSFTLFASASGGTFASGTVGLNFYRASDGSSLGNFSVNINSALAGGFYSVYTVTGLAGLGINLDTTGLIVTQTLTAVTGSTRMGIVSMLPVTVGSTGTSLFADASTINGGAAGFYNFNNAQGAVLNGAAGYQLVVPAPGSMALMALGGLVAARRRGR